MHNDKIKINKITLDLIPSIIKIADEEVGAGYLLPTNLIENKDLSLCASISYDQAVGFCTLLIMTLDEFFSKNNRIIIKYSKYFKDVKRLGIIKTIAVDSKWQFKGIGTALIKNGIQELDLKGIDLIFMMGWKQLDGKININPIRKKFNFKKIGELNNFFYDDSLKLGYTCPFCGNPPCNCSVVLYIRKQ